MIRVYTPAEARVAGVHIEGDEPVSPPPVELQSVPQVRCMSCERPAANKAGFALNRLFTDANGIRWDAPYWTCRHNEELPRKYLVCWDCVVARQWKPCPVCGCGDEYT